MKDFLLIFFIIQVQEMFDSMTEEIAVDVLRKRSLALEEFEVVKDAVRAVFGE